MCIKTIKKHIGKILVTVGVIGTASLTQINLSDLPVNYPLLVNTQIEQLEYSYRAEELLRLEHNEMGRKFRENEITENEWQRYLKNDFESRSLILGGEIGRLRNELGYSAIRVEENEQMDKFISQQKKEFKNSTRWKIKIKNILK